VPHWQFSPVNASDSTVRVFVNERAVDVARGATVAQLVETFDRELGTLVAAAAAYVTDGTGRTVDAADPVHEAGGVYRVIVGGRRGPPALTKEMLRRWPKVELHVHLDGSLRPETMLELARAQNVRLPADTPDALRQALWGGRATSLEDYLTRYDVTLSIMQRADALERIAREFVIDAAREHVRYVEVRYSPLLHRPALSLTQAIESVLQGLARGAQQSGNSIRYGLIVCAIRTLPPATADELVAAAVQYTNAGLVGFDLAGAERGHPPDLFRAAFERAARGGLHTTCHAGEAAGPDSIRASLDVCGVERIGHGTHLGEDASLMERVVARGIPLEMCLTSNAHTHSVPSVAAHPFARYLAAGVRACLNTDGRLVDGVSLTDEYFLAHSVLGVSATDLKRTILTAAESAFLPEYERVALVSRIEADLERV